MLYMVFNIYIICTKKSIIGYTRVYNVQIGPSDGRALELSSNYKKNGFLILLTLNTRGQKWRQIQQNRFSLAHMIALNHTYLTCLCPLLVLIFHPNPLLLDDEVQSLIPLLVVSL